jgi:hypothetical protein
LFSISGHNRVSHRLLGVLSFLHFDSSAATWTKLLLLGLDIGYHTPSSSLSSSSSSTATSAAAAADPPIDAPSTTAALSPALTLADTCARLLVQLQPHNTRAVEAYNLVLGRAALHRRALWTVDRALGAGDDGCL